MLLDKINSYRIFLVMALILIAQVGAVCALTSYASSSSSTSFSTAGTQAQFTSPNRYSGYSQQYASLYWPAITDPDKCEATSDFIMSVRPFSCSPSVVRSDLLEEQSVPVFCKVDVVKINPLIDVSQIKSVKFKNNPGDDSSYVSGVSFHPNREAIYTRQGVIDNPFINDVGYVVVLLKRIQNEEGMPDSVRLNLTGVIQFDAEGFFGAGEQYFYLDPEFDWMTGDSYKENSFFKGKGYLRADWIDGTSAGISIYSDQDTRLSTLTLQKGETSKVVYLPGFYCKAGVQVQLEDLQANIKKARLEVDGDDIWVGEGERFLDGLCQVTSIVYDKNKQREKGNVKVYCAGKTYTLEYENKIDNGVVSEDNKCENINPSEEVMQKYEAAEKYAYEVRGLYGSAIDEQTGEIWAAKALLELGRLADEIGLKADAMDIYQDVIDEFPGSNAADEIEKNDLIDSVCRPSTSYDEHFIKLKRVSFPTDSNASFSVIKDGSTTIQGKDKQVTENVMFADNRFRIEKLYADRVDLYYYKQGTSDSEQFTLSFSEKSRTFIDGEFKYEITLEDINYKQIAKVKLISKMPNEYSESDFTVEIGIEKRAIKLSPEKTQEMINNLNDSIERWEEITENLGNVVKGMKGVCLATSTVLFVKNFIANTGGRATARQKVMPIYYKKCEQKVGSDRGAMDACLVGEEANIKRDIDAYTRIIDGTGGVGGVNKAVIDTQNNNKIPGSDAIDRGATADSLRTSFFSNKPVSFSLGSQTITIKDTELQKASTTQLRDLKAYQEVLNSDASTDFKENAYAEISKIHTQLELKEGVIRADEDSLFDPEAKSEKQFDWLDRVRVEYYPSGKHKNLAYVVPIPKFYDSKTGFYVIVDEGGYASEKAYTDAGDLKRYTIKNLGSDGQPDFANDMGYTYDINQRLDAGQKILGLSHEASKQLVTDASQAIYQANRNYGRSRFSLFEQEVRVNPAGKSTDYVRCQDFMSPSDCHILFNVCDPVLCPSSRCDLGGAYRVDNVIQSGIIGSIALCLPNVKDGIIIPVCLSGIHAGLENYVSILKAHRDCLQESLNTGRQVGVCDEIYSIYLCEFFWRQIGPFMDALIPKLIEYSFGQGSRGGGEYLTVEDAWTDLEKGTDWMKQEYGVNSWNAFNARSTDDIGSEICKNFISTRYPASKDFFDNLLEPDSPVQFSAWFDEIPFSEATVPATSQYKVFYHIYAGKDDGAYFQVYLKTPPDYAYVGVSDTIVVRTGYTPRGSSTSETKDFTAPAGYQELCVRINGKDECGFGKVSTSFAVNYVSDLYYQEQLDKEDIAGSDECISGENSLLGALRPNIQEGVDTAINPELEKKGVVRICSTKNPGIGVEETRWKKVGYCDDEEMICWLDKRSVEDVIKNKNIASSIVEDTGAVKTVIDESEIWTMEKVGEVFDNSELLFFDIKNERKKVGDAETITAVNNMIASLDDVQAHSYNYVAAEAVYWQYKLYDAYTSKLYEARKPSSGVVGGEPTISGTTETPVVSSVSIFEYKDGKVSGNLFYKFDSEWYFATNKNGPWYKIDELDIATNDYGDSASFLTRLKANKNSYVRGVEELVSKFIVDSSSCTLFCPAVEVTKSSNVKSWGKSDISSSASMAKAEITREILDFTGGGDLGGSVKEDNKKVIVIDPGHGGDSLGAISSIDGTKEKDVNLQIASALKNELITAGYRVIMTRERDISVNLQDRVTIAKENNANYFVSIHANSAEDCTNVKGVEVYYSNNRDLELANSILIQLSNLGFENRGVKEDSQSQYRDLYVLQNTEMPSVLVEVGFLCNQADLTKIKSTASVAEAISNGVSSVV
ncbi:MAG: N-acetylmuramoyl-L-alanine amidase [archaeon]